MSRSVDKRIVEMDLNNEQFEKNAKTSISTIQKLKQALSFDNAEDGFYRVEKAASTVNLNPIINSVDELTNKFNAFGIFGIEVMRKISNAAIETGEKIWNATIGQIKSGGSARALNIANAQFKLEGLGVAWKEASKDISAAVDGTAYGFDAAANTASQLATAGIELGEAYGGMAHALKAVSGVAAMTNASYEEIGYIFSQIAAAGRLMGQDATQISTRGINVTATLAKQLGKTIEEIKKMQEKGEISFAMFSEAMYDAFGEQAAKANNTFQGALSNVKAALSRIGEIWYGPFYNAAITPLNKIRVAINNIKKAFDDGDESTEDFKTRLTELMGIVSNIFSWLTENVDLRFFTNIANGANMVLDVMNDIGHAIEKTLGIFKTDKAVEENEKLADSLKDLTEAELQAAKDIWETGKYGNGQDRINNLLAAGFTEEGARRVQLAINKFIDSNYQWVEVEKEVGKQAEENDKKMEGLSQTITSKFVRSFIAARNAASVLGDAIGNVASGVWNIVKMVGSSFVENFNFEIIFKDIESIAYRIRFFTEEFRKFTTGNTKFRKFIDEIFKVANDIYRVIRAAASILNTVISSLYKVIKETISGLDMGEVSISNFTDKIATWAENLALIIKRSEIFVVIFRKIVDVIKSLLNYAKQLPSTLQPFFDKAKKNLDILLDKFKNVSGVDLTAGIKSAWETIKNFFKTLSNPFGSSGDETEAVTRWAEKSKDSVLNVFNNSDGLFSKIKDWVLNAFNKLKESIDGISKEEIAPKVLHIFASIVKFIQNLEIPKAIKNMVGVGLIVTALVATLKVIKLVDTLQKPAESVKKLVGNLIGTIGHFKELSSRITAAMEKDLMANAFIKFAAGIAIMAAAIAGLGMLDTTVLIKGLTALSICVIALAGSIAVYNKTVDPRAMKLLDTTLIQFGISIGIMAAVVAVLGNMSYEKLAKGLIMLDIIALLYSGLMVINRVFRGGKNDIWKGILALAVAMDALIPFITIIGNLSVWKAVKGIGAMTVIFMEMMAMTTAAAFLSEKFDSLDILGIAASMGLLALAMDATIPFLELIGRMKIADVVTGIGGFGVMLVAIAGVLVGASKAMSGLDTVDMAVIAASIGIIVLTFNALIPSLITMAAMEKINEGSVFEIISSLTTILVAIGGILTLMSMMTVGTDTFLIAASLVGVVMSFNLLIPGLIALAAVPIDALMKVVGVIATLGLVFTIVVGVLAAINAATAGGVVLIMSIFAIQLGEIAFTIIAGALALGVAAVMLAKAVMNVAVAADTFSTVNGDKIIENAKKFVEAFQILAVGLYNVAPKVSKSIQSLTSGVTKGVIEGIITAINDNIKAVSDIINKAAYYLVKTIVANLAGFMVGIIAGVITALAQFLEWITDESGGKSMLERIGHALVDSLIIVLDVLTQRMDEIVTWIVDFIIAVVKAATKTIQEKGDEWLNAWNEFWGTVTGFMLKALNEQAENIELVGKTILGYIWDGVKAKWNELLTDIYNGVKTAEKAVKKFFGIDQGDNTGSIFYKIGVKNIELLGEGIKAAWQGGNKLKDWLAEQMGSFVGEMLDDIAGGVDKESGEAANKMGLAMHGMVPQMLWKAFRMRSPSQDMWEAGKNLLLGLVNGVKDNLGLSELSLGNLFGDIKDSLLGDLGLDSEGGESFMDKLMGELGIDDENTFSLTPILDTSQFEKDYSSFANDIGLDTDYSFGSTTSGLGSDISFQTQGGISQSGFTSENVEGLRTDVQDIAERIGRLEVRMDTGALVGALYAGIDEKLGEKQILAGRGVYA